MQSCQKHKYKRVKRRFSHAIKKKSTKKFGILSQNYYYQ